VEDAWEVQREAMAWKFASSNKGIEGSWGCE